MEEFKNRVQAAEALSKKLSDYRGKNPLILGIPRGAVPMAQVLAQQLHGDLDVVLVHKISAPENPEFAIGSVSEFGTVTISEVAYLCEVPPGYLQKAADSEIHRLREKRKWISPVRPALSPKNRIVIIVDDGIATGSTMLAAVRAIRAQKPKRLIVAAPMGSPKAMDRFRQEIDELVVLEAPESFYSISQFYEDFPQVTDDEVLQILAQASKNQKAA
ncbi:MAG: phosphoribosyltransferase [Bdellovibrionia bacterium]